LEEAKAYQELQCQKKKKKKKDDKIIVSFILK
jgi:hypothetical protein